MINTPEHYPPQQFLLIDSTYLFAREFAGEDFYTVPPWMKRYSHTGSVQDERLPVHSG